MSDDRPSCPCVLCSDDDVDEVLALDRLIYGYSVTFDGKRLPPAKLDAFDEPRRAEVRRVPDVSERPAPLPPPPPRPILARVRP